MRGPFSVNGLANVVLALITVAVLSACTSIKNVMMPSSIAKVSASIAIDQGEKWTPAARQQFYTQDQGSQLIPLRWILALKQPANGRPFLEESLGRYGYLPMVDPENNPYGLPVGFTLSTWSGKETLGLSCSACHTRQIEVEGISYRIDGGPAIVDIQAMLSDLDSAVNNVLADPIAFSAFAQAVLTPPVSADKEKALRTSVEAWYLPYHTVMARALPKKPWGVGRLDALSMIINRVAGLDIGPPPGYLIPENIATADAPVRYPFLWNAAIQDKTQWPGIADNGNEILGLARNLGEVLGVFAVFHPTKDQKHLLGINYIDNNSANFDGLKKLEALVWKIGPPKWPWAIDKTLVDRGRGIFQQTCAAGCHEIKKGEKRSLLYDTWATPLQDVGTDSREYSVLTRMVDTGVLAGAYIPVILKEPLKQRDLATNVLKASGAGAILQHCCSIMVSEPIQERVGRFITFLNKGKNKYLKDLEGAYSRATEPSGNAPFAYEARVMEGIWAAAPYLHNGSVPNMVELLKPANERVASFKVGPAYDPVNIGLAVEQSRFGYTMQTTDCDDRDSGNSRCGHEFGTDLSQEDKKALIEYLKTL